MENYEVVYYVQPRDKVVSVPENAASLSVVVMELEDMVRVTYLSPVEKGLRGPCGHTSCGWHRHFTNDHCAFINKIFQRCEVWQPEEDDAEQQ